jgi:hypothetical protein
LAKRVKRVAFGYRSFRNYRVRALLYAGKPQLGSTRDDHNRLKSQVPDYERYRTCDSRTRS